MSFLLFFIGEFLLIFIGVTLSLQFSNWNDSRRLKGEELHILKQLQSSFKRDREDVTSNRDGRLNAKKACQTILQLRDKAVGYHDSLDAIFGAAYEVRGTVNEMSPYENLKSKGFDLISNDTLRLAIIDIYDTKYRQIHDSEAIHENLFFNTLVQFNATRFYSSNPPHAMKPVAYDKLIHDSQYRYYLNVLIFYNDFLMWQDEDIINEINDILSRIDREIRKFQ
jgi:hypothetical protein